VKRNAAVQKYCWNKRPLAYLTFSVANDVKWGKLLLHEKTTRQQEIEMKFGKET
jgi:hypothetical protein